MNFQKNLIIIFLCSTTMSNASMMQNTYQAIPNTDNSINSTPRTQRPEIAAQKIDRTTDHAMHIQTTPQHPSTTQYICCNCPQIRDCTEHDVEICRITCISLTVCTLIAGCTACAIFVQ